MAKMVVAASRWRAAVVALKRRILIPSSHWRTTATFFSTSSLGENIKDGSRLNLFVSCLPGLEPFLSRELKQLGILNSISKQTGGGGVYIHSASVHVISRIHLNSGIASHVTIKCGKPFHATNFIQLKQKVAKMNWNDWVEEDVVFDCRVTCRKSKLYHTRAIAERIQDAIDQSLGRDRGNTVADSSSLAHHDVTTTSNHSNIKVVPLIVRINRDIVEIAIDTSKTPIHQRGYRLQTAKAPLREDIAFAMLFSAGWPYKDLSSVGVVDPFCGSGTIAIEAAMMKVGIPPGRLRNAPLEGTKLYSPVIWDNLITESTATTKTTNDATIFVCASDRDDGAIMAAKANAERAGVANYIDLSSAALSYNPWLHQAKSKNNNKDKHYPVPSKVLLATNPPYGKRTSPGKKVQDLLPLHQSLGHQFLSLKKEKNLDCSAIILGKDVRLIRRTALPDLKALFTTDHGGTKVTAMGYDVTNNDADQSKG